MKKDRKKVLFLFLFLSFLLVGNAVFAYDQAILNLINNYKTALDSQDSKSIQKAYEALKAHSEAVTHMQKKLSPYV